VSVSGALGSVASEALVRRLDDIGEAVFGDLEEMRIAVLPAFGGDRPPRSRDLGIEDRVTGLLRRAGDRLVGAGFVAEPGVLRDVEHWLEWWTATGPPARRRVRRLVVQSDPVADDFRDYTTLPWFRVPRRTGERHLTGPYVDYLCTDEYTLTFTAPVEHLGRFVGVVGADVEVRWVEDQLSGELLATGLPTTVVSSSGRVLTSTVGSLTTGDLVREFPAWWDAGEAPQGNRLLRCAGLPLGLLVHRS
jgi:hypothetical protein